MMLLRWPLGALVAENNPMESLAVGQQGLLLAVVSRQGLHARFPHYRCGCPAAAPEISAARGRQRELSGSPSAVVACWHAGFDDLSRWSSAPSPITFPFREAAARAAKRHTAVAGLCVLLGVVAFAVASRDFFFFFFFAGETVY